MEDLLEICKMRDAARTDIGNMCAKFREQFSQMLRGKMDLALPKLDSVSTDHITPHQSLKRAKKLSNVREGDETQEPERLNRRSNLSLLAEAESLENECMQTMSLHKTTTIRETIVNETVTMNTTELIPESAKQADFSFARPARQAKLKAEKNLKEVKTNAKMRRPSNFDVNTTVTIKKEKDVSVAQNNEAMENSIVICDKAPVIIDLLDDSDKSIENDAQATKPVRVVIKREKLSLETADAVKEKTLTRKASVEKPAQEAVPAKIVETMETTQAASVTSSNSQVVSKKKKKHVPIKVERFSDIDKKSAANETGKKSAEQHSVYEDAVEKLPAQNKVTADQTITLPNKTTVTNDATFCTNDKTMTISTENTNNTDETFNVAATNRENNSMTSSKHSMETAKESVSQNRNDSLLTDDESHNEYIKIEKDDSAPKTKNSAAPVNKKQMLQ